MLHLRLMSMGTALKHATTYAEPRSEQLAAFIRLSFILQPVKKGDEHMKWGAPVVLWWFGIFDWMVFSRCNRR